VFSAASRSGLGATVEEDTSIQNIVISSFIYVPYTHTNIFKYAMGTWFSAKFGVYWNNSFLGVYFVTCSSAAVSKW